MAAHMQYNEPPKGIQELIHSLEEGSGRVWLQRFIVLLITLIALGLYHVDGVKNLSAVEAMDQAQLGRSLAEGRGFTTQIIRPLSLHLQTPRATQAGTDPRLLIRAAHPDISNPPLYPAALGLLFKVLPDRWVYGVEAGPRRRPPAEVALGCFNFAGFLCLVFALYQVGRRWFEVSIGVMAVVVFAGSKLNWDFAFSGLPTVWLGLLCLAVAAVAMRIGGAADPDAEGRPRIVTFRYGVWSAVLGGLLGVGFLVSYSFGFLVLPVAICVGWWAPSEARVRTVGCLLLAFLLLATPWMARNYLRSGLPLGIATLAPLAGTPAFTEDQLERSQNPDLSRVRLAEVLAKVLSNSHHILSNDVPRMFGNWFGAFLLVGLLLPMGDARMNRFRWLLLSMLLALVPAQALIQTHLATLSPYLNSENLLAWFVPLAGLYAAVVFRWALDSFDFPFPLARWMALVVPMGLCLMPFVISLLPPRQPVMANPPYYLPVIRQLLGYLPPGAMVLSDMPAAVAWYGHLDSMPLTLRAGQDPKEDFYQIHDFQRPFNALLLTPLTCDQLWHSKLLNDPDAVWGRFYMDYLLRQGNIPSGFPLKFAFGDRYPENGYLLVADRPYWRETRK